MDTATYQKTLQGIDEINHRSNAISSRLRRVLIMIDGRKDFEQLQKMAPGEDIAHALQQLTELHLIEPHIPSMAELLVGNGR